MKVIYQGKEITKSIRVKKCTVKDTSGKSDSIDITFADSNNWYSWKPKEDDSISVEKDNYSSGTMFVNTIIPENGDFRILASSLPCRARNKRNKSYFDRTLENIIRECALESAMEYQVYGLDTSIHIPYIERNNEGCSAFLQRLLTLEGATLKCINNRYVIIGIQYAQDKENSQVITVNPAYDNVQHIKSGMRYKGITIKSLYGEGSAYDYSVNSERTHIICNDFPILSDIQAFRWARNKLLDLNRKTEKLIFSNMMFNPLITSMIKIGISSDTEIAGEWLVDEVIHDLIKNKTSFDLVRCVNTIQ